MPEQDNEINKQDDAPVPDDVNELNASTIDLNDPISLGAQIYQIWWHWADFSLYIISPHIERVSPPIVIEAEEIAAGEKEFVYSIYDHGDHLSTSKGEEMFSVGKSMCKLFYTIEKMINILIERLKAGGIDPQTEVQVAFQGHQLPQRKAFESIINLSYNVVVTNFDPGQWGNDYLATVKRLADKGYGYPSETPRQPYKMPHNSSPKGIKQ